MSEADIRLQIRVRNARVLRAMEAAGVDTVAELCRRIPTKNQFDVGAIINFKRKPIQRNGEWHWAALGIATVLHRQPEELWPEYLREIEAKKTETHLDVTAEQFGAITSGERAALDRDQVQRLLVRLPPREATVIEMRFGLNGNGEHSLEEIGQAFGGLSRSRVAQIEDKALRRMRRFA